jgi:pimeloyl-ACP methyl ester carboxylesterase
VRLITTDRPGIDLSDRKPRRRVIDWPDDVERLADHLGLERFAVVGFSMGGAYAAACALRLPGRMTCAALVNPVGRIDTPGFVDGMATARYLKLARRAPWAMRSIYSTVAWTARRNPDRAHDLFWRGASKVDRAVVDRAAVRRRFMEALGEAATGGSRGLVDDMRVAQRPWGFDPKDIEMPIDLWHGRADRIVPPDHAEHWIASLANCRTRSCDGEGHYLIEDHIEEILDAAVTDVR